MHQLAAALCLVLVLEGLLLFAAPASWQAMMRQALTLSPRTLRLFGACAVIIGLVLLRWFH
ncbi:hypothetical protein ASD22_06405 [Rhodanobacter sp. Root480]|jgi:uncharacterized protein YjeT (DUF2065 family)|uniref:DUF2065 domain-containing protein n=1 Tax=unclassified Rhodanobacter TaxID=2621553 RepID=UPI0006FD5D48|nr:MULTISPECIES: DUF2065 domain-containing protein [unclassified Rhodanobacter]KQX99847.1 hypothetical protein ASD22_06405 [Rhodanobacter sp. Root480]KRA36046.1 hypothetical protein ASD68_06730 [Rhodanobacter sp. Root627]